MHISTVTSVHWKPGQLITAKFTLVKSCEKLSSSHWPDFAAYSNFQTRSPDGAATDTCYITIANAGLAGSPRVHLQL